MGNLGCPVFFWTAKIKIEDSSRKSHALEFSIGAQQFREWVNKWTIYFGAVSLLEEGAICFRVTCWATICIRNPNPFGIQTIHHRICDHFLRKWWVCNESGSVNTPIKIVFSPVVTESVFGVVIASFESIRGYLQTNFHLNFFHISWHDI